MPEWFPCKAFFQKYCSLILKGDRRTNSLPNKMNPIFIMIWTFLTDKLTVELPGNELFTFSTDSIIKEDEGGGEVGVGGGHNKIVGGGV